MADVQTTRTVTNWRFGVEQVDGTAQTGEQVVATVLVAYDNEPPHDIYKFVLSDEGKQALVQALTHGIVIANGKMPK